MMLRSIKLIHGHLPVVAKHLVRPIARHGVEPVEGSMTPTHVDRSSEDTKAPCQPEVNLAKQFPCNVFTHPSLAYTKGQSGNVASATTKVWRKPASTLVSWLAGAGTCTCQAPPRKVRVCWLAPSRHAVRKWRISLRTAMAPAVSGRTLFTAGIVTIYNTGVAGQAAPAIESTVV